MLTEYHISAEALEKRISFALYDPAEPTQPFRSMFPPSYWVVVDLLGALCGPFLRPLFQTV